MPRLDPLLLAAASAALGLGAAACGPGDDDTTCAGILPGELVVTEVLADFGAPTGTSGADEGREWFEVYNASSRPLELEGVVLEHGRPDATPDAIKRHPLRAATVEPGGYLVLGNVLPDLAPAHVDYGYAGALGDLYNTGSGRLGLRCGTTLVDEANYQEPSAGQSRALDGGAAPDYLANDQATSWCETDEVASYEYEPGNYGTPGGANPDCMVVIPGTCDDGGTMRPSVPPQIGDLVITEVMPSPGLVSDTIGEWFEVLATRDVDLNGVGLARGTGTPSVITAASCQRVTAGSYLVFAKNADMTMNGGVAGVDGTFTFDLVAGSAASPGNVRLLVGATELDTISWTSSRNLRALQLDAGLTTPADNDLSTNLCDATTAYNPMDFGTPGAANLACGVVTTGMCTDPGTGTLRPIVKPTTGQLVINEWLPNTEGAIVTDATGEWIELRATAAVDLNGLQAGVASLGAMPLIPAGGDCVRLAAGGLAVLARTTMGNGLPAAVTPAALFGFTLPNTGARTLLIGVDGAMIDSKSWTGLDTVADKGRAYQLDSDGTQCVVPAGANEYTPSNFGTPGTANTPECP